MDSQQPIQNNLNAYKIVFVLENNLRVFISTVLEKKFGSNWFEKINKTIQDRSFNNRHKEIKYLSSEYISQNPLNYVYTSDLRKVILDFWNIFSNHFFDIKDKKTVSDKLFEIEVIRHSIAHNNLINDLLINQLLVNYQFFKCYIHDFDDNIFYVDLNNYSPSIEKISKIRDIEQKVNRYEKINNDEMDIIKSIDLELYNNLIDYNKFPRVKRSIKKIEDFVVSQKIKEKLNGLLGVSNV